MEEEVKVSELAEATTINNDDLIMTIQNNINKKATFSKVLDKVEPIIDNKELLAQYGDSYIDPDTTLYPLILSRHTNCPEGQGTFYYIRTIFYGSISTTSQRVQVAIGYNKADIYQRYRTTAWEPWVRVSSNITPAQAATDFNTLNESNTYFFGSVPTGNNKPASTGLQSGVLEVFKHPSSSLISQRYTNFDGSKIYVRGSYQNGWSAWGTITPV